MKAKNTILYYLSAVIIILLMYSSMIFADDPVMREIIVTSQRSGKFLNSSGSGTVIFDRDDISALNAGSISELLQAIPSIDLSERGTPGSQIDPSLRGSSFEGVLVLVNGVSIRDPQTGHFTMDIPVDIRSIERVEVLPGGGSTLYGSSAIGGVVNIVTTSGTHGVDGVVSAGSYGTTAVSAGFGLKMVGTDAAVRLRSGRSDGDMPGTDGSFVGVDASGTVDVGGVLIDWNAGMLDKEFGAEGFYAPYSSFEKVKTYLAGINARFLPGPKSMVRLRAGARGHGDDFILDRGNPSFYRNTHYNRSYIVSSEYTVQVTESSVALAGVESALSGITSGSLGSHTDRNDAVYGEISGLLEKFGYSLSLRYDTGIADDPTFTYGAGLDIPLTQTINFRLRTEKSFRSPTYTELYYLSPANLGNEHLKSEHSRSLETGIDVTGNLLHCGLSLFSRKSNDVIDWIRVDDVSPWKAENHGSVMTYGGELRGRTTFKRGWTLNLAAQLLDQTVDSRKGIKSKYVLNPQTATVSGSLTGVKLAWLTWAMLVRYEEMLQGDSRTPITLSCTRKFNDVTAVVSVRNLMNERYDEIPGLRAPGQWFTFRLEYR
ncbi:TonB-dependent receptor plug domain-containing protein [Candidatus Latescibacterota bacterium]